MHQETEPVAEVDDSTQGKDVFFSNISGPVFKAPHSIKKIAEMEPEFPRYSMSRSVVRSNIRNSQEMVEGDRTIEIIPKESTSKEEFIRTNPMQFMRDAMNKELLQHIHSLLSKNPQEELNKDEQTEILDSIQNQILTSIDSKVFKPIDIPLII